MSRRIAGLVLPLICLLLGTMLAQAAEDVLKLVPDSALGFVVLNRPAALDKKVQRLGQQLQLPIPSLLNKLKGEGGVREGLDEKGTICLIVLPSAAEGSKPTPVLLVPVTDYDKFLDQWKAEKASGTTTIELWGSQCCVRSVGGYAALTDVPHKDILEKTLKVLKEVPSALAPWQRGLKEHDAVLVILQPGIKRLAAFAQEGIRTMKAVLEKAGPQGQQAVAAFGLYGQLIQFAEKEVTAVSFAAQLDKQGSLRIVKRARLVPGGGLAQMAAALKPAGEDLLAGLPDAPFVAAGGGVIPQGLWEPMMKFSIDLMKSMPQLYGLSEEQLKKMPRTSFEAMKSVRSMSLVLGVGKSGQPVYSNLVAVMRVDDSQAFLQGYDKAMGDYNKFAREAKSPVLQPAEIEKTQIQGVSALRLTMKMPKMPNMAEIPQYDKMTQAMFGPGGKMVAWLAPAGPRAVVMSYTNKEPLQEAIRLIQDAKPGLAGDAELAKTAVLLPKDAPAVGYWSPKGTIAFVNRLVPAVAKGVAFQIPDFPATPPIGFSVTAGPNELRGHIAVPAEIFTAIGQYVQKVRGK